MSVTVECGVWTLDYESAVSGEPPSHGQSLLAVWCSLFKLQHHLPYLPRQILVLQHICSRFHYSQDDTSHPTVYPQTLAGTGWPYMHDGFQVLTPKPKKMLIPILDS